MMPPPIIAEEAKPLKRCNVEGALTATRNKRKNVATTPEMEIEACFLTIPKIVQVQQIFFVVLTL